MSLESNPLFALLPVGREVAINGGKTKVVGVPWNFIGKLIGKFPQLAEALAENKVTIAVALTAIPDAVPSFLAAGVAKPGDAEAEDILGRLPAVDQLTLINEILVETMGGDKDFFVAKLTAVAKTAGFVGAAPPPAIPADGIRLRSVKR